MKSLTSFLVHAPPSWLAPGACLIGMLVQLVRQKTEASFFAGVGDGRCNIAAFAATGYYPPGHK